MCVAWLVGWLCQQQIFKTPARAVFERESTRRINKYTIYLIDEHNDPQIDILYRVVVRAYFELHSPARSN